MSESLKRILKPFKYTIGKFISFFLSRLLSLTAALLRAARKSGFQFESVWPPEFRPPFRSYEPPPFSLQDLLLLTESRPSKQKTKNEKRELIASIIIPVFNKAEYTFQCLRALAKEVDLTRNEIIIVNNASTDETARLLNFFLDKVRVINNRENEGFVTACNRGAAMARGRYLVFLNNDTLVQPKWLDYLLETAENDQTAGAVGSLLLYPDGRIQEAGGIIRQDGTAHHYGYSAHPDDFRFNYARETDYCSGASLLVKKDLFGQLGGFDARYAPAYYEDADLCMGVRSLGYKVIYQPLSKVVHFEGVTAGTDTQSGFKRFQTINHAKFYEKWRAVLEAEHLSESIAGLEKAANRSRGLKILVCDEKVPLTKNDAGSVRMLEILKILKKHGRVVFSPLNFLDAPVEERELHKIGVQIVPRLYLKSFITKENFDAAIVSRPDVGGQTIKLIRRQSPRTKIIYDTVDAYFVRFAREFEVTRSIETQKKAARYKKLETRLVREADQTWCVTENDKNSLLESCPEAEIRIVPTIHAIQKGGSDFAARKDLLFVGSFGHHPNTDAMLFFKERILPRLSRLLPDAVLYVAGSSPSPEIWELNSEKIRVLGFVDDLRPLLNNCRVFVCPLRFGAGMKGKIGEALAAGLPVVTTAVGAEGMDLTSEQEVLIVDEPEDFAVAVAKIYGDEELWDLLSANGQDFVETRFSPAVTEKKILSAFEKLGLSIGSARES